MIYLPATPDDPLDQGDLFHDCPIASVDAFDPAAPAVSKLSFSVTRAVVLTQTCDLANSKTPVVNVASVFDADFFIEAGILKATDIKGSLRAGRMWGFYFLPADPALGLPEMIVDLRRLYTVKPEHLVALARAGKRPGRIKPLYREHLAKHFADTFSRIGLPRPVESL